MIGPSLLALDSYPYVLLALGLISAMGGGELFVRGSVGLASVARVPPGVIGVTVAAFATSSPELTVAFSSALAREPEISFGDALGSNVVNITLVFGAALALGPLAFDRGPILKNFAAAAAAPVAVAVLLRDGEISRGEAMLLLAGFFTWLFAVLVDALRQRHEAAPANAGLGFTRSSIFSLVGLALLIVAGKMIVMGAGRIARDYGLSEFVIGSTLVAIGTSTPELATAIISRLRKHDDIGVGALLGSNIFNGLFIVGVAGAISPIHAPLIEATPALGFGLTALIIAFPPADGVYRRWRGFALLMLHAAFLAATVWVER